MKCFGNGNTGRIELHYNGVCIGYCAYDNGANTGHYYYTEDGCRFFSTFWQNVDDRNDNSIQDEGTPFKFDWGRFYFDCLSGTLDHECLESATQQGGEASSETENSSCE